MKHLLLLSFFLFPPSLYAIDGGQATSPQVQASVVNVIFKFSACTGVLIAPQVVATAAHCINQSGEPQQVAWISEIRPTDPCNIKDVVDYEIEPSAQRTLFRRQSPDIALIRIAEPLCSASPAKLGLTTPAVGERFRLAGHSGRDTPYGVASAIEVTIFDFANISDHVYSEVPRAMNNIQRLIDAGPLNYVYGLPDEGGQTICFGDSGGPAYQVDDTGGMVLYGVNGFNVVNERLGNMSSCRNGYVQAFTPIAPYLDWIQSKITEWQ